MHSLQTKGWLVEDQIQVRAPIVNNRHCHIGETVTFLKSPPSTTQLKIEILQNWKFTLDLFQISHTRMRTALNLWHQWAKSIWRKTTNYTSAQVQTGLPSAVVLDPPHVKNIKLISTIKEKFIRNFAVDKIIWLTDFGIVHLYFHDKVYLKSIVSYCQWMLTVPVKNPKSYVPILSMTISPSFRRCPTLLQVNI